MSELKIEAMAAGDLEAVAEIHALSLSEDLLPALGRAYLEKGFYKACLSTQEGRVLVAREGGKVTGFVCAAAKPPAFLREAMQASLGRLAWAMLGLVLTRPWRFLEALAALASTRGIPEGGEIAFIAVAPGERGRGIGPELVQGVHAYFKERGLRQAFTKTLRENADVIAMYGRWGATLSAPFRVRNKEYVYLSWKIP